MKTTTIICLITVLLSLPLTADNLSGRDVMQKVRDVPDGKDRRGKTTMVLVNRRNNKRVRTVLFFEKDCGDDAKNIMYFLSPADVKGTGFLQFSYEKKGKDDNKWLYLPAFRKLRRISSSQKNDRFMGTDFTYDDLSRHNIDEYTHKLLKETTVDGTACWVVESRPKDPESLYSKTVKWIRKDNSVPIKVEYYDTQGKPLKVRTLEKKNGFWVAVKTVMHNVQENHKTIMVIDDIQHNTGLRENFFRPATLEKGITK